MKCPHCDTEIDSRRIRKRYINFLTLPDQQTWLDDFFDPHLVPRVGDLVNFAGERQTYRVAKVHWFIDDQIAVNVWIERALDELP